MPATRLFALTLACLFLPSIANATDLRVAVASNFATTLKQLKPIFEKEHDLRLIIIKGSTGKLFAQIIHGAPYDVFLAADKRRPRILEQKNLIIKNSRLTYAIGQLALWSSGNTDKNTLNILKTNKFNKIAIANPKTAPYGEASVQLLKYLDLYQSIKAKLVRGENISQTYQFVQSGNADIGFVAFAEIKRHNNKHYWLPDAKTYNPLEQQLVILKQSSKKIQAKYFTTFLMRQDIQKIIQQHGYLTAQ